MLESDLQQAVFTWAGTKVTQYPELIWMHAVPNGGRRDGREAQSMKAQGVRAGVLDIALDVARGGYHGLKIELKKPDGKIAKPSKEQAEYIEFCEGQGYYCLVSNDFEQVKETILMYLDGFYLKEAF